MTLEEFSIEEFKLCKLTESIKGSMEEQNQFLTINSVFDKYRNIHKEYLILFNSAPDDSIKLEALKRLIFLNWEAEIEPSFLTGLEDLDTCVVATSYALLNEYIIQNKLDNELTWMLSYYSSWSDMIPFFSDIDLPGLKTFVEGVDTSILKIPPNLSKNSRMNNRGQMGIYFLSMSKEMS
jgi:hypothetical protein